MITEADERIDAAKEHVDYAIADIYKVVIDKCYGSEDYADDYVGRLYKAMSALIGIKSLLR